MLTVLTCTSTQGERYQETMKLVLSMFYALLSPDNHLSLTRNTNSVTSKSSIVCCSSKLLCLGCCQHRISTQCNRDYLYWTHSKWRPVGYHSYFKEGVVLERVYFLLVPISYALINVMHLSLSRPTYPRSGSGWGFVGDSSPKLVPMVGAFATRIAILGHNVSDSRDK